MWYLLPYANKNNLLSRLFSILILLFISSLSYADPIKAGKHYKVLSPHILSQEEILQLRAEHPNKPQVIMFFSYACYWCGQLNRPFDEWAATKKDDIVTSHVPVAFSKPWEVLAKTYYTVSALDNADQLDDAIFDGIHKKHLHLIDHKLLTKFLINHGVAEEKFQQLFNSFSVDRQIKRAHELSLAFEISTTPNIIVLGANEGYLTSWAMTGTQQKLFRVLDYLLEKTHIEQKPLGTKFNE